MYCVCLFMVNCTVQHGCSFFIECARVSIPVRILYIHICSPVCGMCCAYIQHFIPYACICSPVCDACIYVHMHTYALYYILMYVRYWCC